MLANLKTSYRFIIKGKSFTIINLTGLVIGLTISFYFLTYTINEATFNHYIPEHSSTYRVLMTDPQGMISALSPFTLADTLEKGKDLPGIFTRLINVPGTLGPVMAASSRQEWEESGAWMADPSFFSFFGIELLTSEPGKTLSGPDQIAVSASFAREHLNDLSPPGNTLALTIQGITDTFRISGVFQDFPWNSTFRPALILPASYLPRLFIAIDSSLAGALYSLNETFTETYFRASAEFPPDSLKTMIKKAGYPYFQNTAGNGLDIQAVSEIYMDSGHLNGNFHDHGDKSSVLVYPTLAFIVLLLAGINYSILSTARAALRYKEVGVRKVLGASANNLLMQILAESVILTLIALPLAMLLKGLLEPLTDFLQLNQVRFYRENLRIYLSLFGAITLFIGVLSGLYVALFLVAMNPLEALKARLYPQKKFNLSKVFIVFQLAITMGLLTGVITITRQIWFFHTRNPGFDTENILVVKFDYPIRGRYKELRENIARTGGVAGVSTSTTAPASDMMIAQPLNSPFQSQSILHEVISVDDGFFRTLGVRFLEGEDFNGTSPSLNINKIIINESMARETKQAGRTGDSIGHLKIIGIVEDFLLHSMHKKVFPVIFYYDPGSATNLVIRHEENLGNQVRHRIDSLARSLFSDQIVRTHPLDKSLKVLYRKEQNFALMVALMTFLSLIVTAMGLFGLAILISERKTRETAIRKVFGASNRDIMFRMQKEFLTFIAIAAGISIPVTALLMNAWLNRFYYHVSAGWYIYLLTTTAITLFVSFILYQRMKTVLLLNPVIALKYD